MFLACWTQCAGLRSPVVSLLSIQTSNWICSGGLKIFMTGMVSQHWISPLITTKWHWMHPRMGGGVVSLGWEHSIFRIMNGSRLVSHSRWTIGQFVTLSLLRISSVLSFGVINGLVYKFGVSQTLSHVNSSLEMAALMSIEDFRWEELLPPSSTEGTFYGVNFLWCQPRTP